MKGGVGVTSMGSSSFDCKIDTCILHTIILTIFHTLPKPYSGLHFDNYPLIEGPADNTMVHKTSATKIWKNSGVPTS